VPFCWLPPPRGPATSVSTCICASASQRAAHIAEPRLSHPPGPGYVAVRVPTTVYVDGHYYVYKERIYAAPHYTGPWFIVSTITCRRGWRNIDTKIIELRDAEYRSYQKNRAGYKGKTFHPGKGGGEEKGKGKGKGNGKQK
jgi:hypothetical protein